MQIRFKDLGSIITGTTPTTKTNKYYEHGIYDFITPSEIKDTRFALPSNKRINQLAFTNYKNRFLSANSILIDCIGSDMGNAAITKTTCLTNQQINAITKINTNIVNPLYLYYKLSTMKHYFHIIGMNGSTMPIINKSVFENIVIQIHDMNLQQHIVDTTAIPHCSILK